MPDLGQGPAGCVGWPAVTTDTQGHRTGRVLFDSQGRASGYCNGEGGCWNVGDCQLSGTWVGETYTGDSHGQPTISDYQQAFQGMAKSYAPIVVSVIGVCSILFAASVLAPAIMRKLCNWDRFVDTGFGSKVSDWWEGVGSRRGASHWFGE